MPQGEPASPPSVRSAPRARRGVLELLTRHGWVPLAALLLALAGVFAFISLTDEVLEEETVDFDQRLFEAMAGRYQRSGPAAQEMWRDLSALGGMTVITLLAAGVTLFLLLRRQWRSAGFLVISIVGGLIISSLIKYLINRARPDFLEAHELPGSPSFPSGHATHSAVVYLAIAILLTKLVESVRLKAYILAMGLLVPLLVGISRIALAVHWPTDVVGGWLIGLAWGLLVYAAATYMQAHGAIEQQGEMEHAE